MTPLEIISICAPMVAPTTLAAIAGHESGGNPLAVHDNTTGASHRPQTQAEAIALAKSLLALGHSIDLGMGQINSKNLPWLGQSAETIFNPCVNLTAMQTVLLAAWRQSGGSLPNTLSIYNTGKVSASGASYAASVYARARSSAPAIVIPAIPNGSLPAWVTKSLPPGAGLRPPTPEAVRRRFARTGTGQESRMTAPPFPGDPAGSPLGPSADGLRPTKDL